MKTVGGSTSKTFPQPNLCCRLAPYITCPRCDWAICKECRFTPDAKAIRRESSGSEMFALHPVCEYEKCKKKIHWLNANTELFNWLGNQAYICTPCLDKGRVSISDFIKVAKEQ